MCQLRDFEPLHVRERVFREVKASVEAFKHELAQFEALQNDGQPDEVKHAQKELLSQLKTLNWCAY